MKFYTDGQKIRDEKGRQRFFRGENICIKEPDISAAELDENINKQLDLCLQAGSNIIRLGVTWALLEQEEGKYNDDVIDVLHRFVKKCEEKDVWVMLDMHQDLYSPYFYGDGMPAWAVDQNIEGQKFMAIWAEGYFYMDSVQQGFNDFWCNKDGVQDKFVEMWKYFASHFTDCGNVIGLDFLNEPYITNHGRTIFLNIVKRVVKINYNKDIDPEAYFVGVKDKKGFINLVKKLAGIIVLHGGPFKLLKATDNYDQFKAVMSGLDEYTKEFNEKYYQPFIHRLSEEVQNNGFSFFEHNYYSNLGIPFDIETKENFVYSPHAYDLFVDSPLYNKYSSNARIKFITDEIKKNQDRMNVPVIFGEWGCGANGTKWIDHIEYVMDIMEKNQWSNIYWSYRHENEEFCHRINRPYPVAICGEVKEIKTDAATRTFNLTFEQGDGFEDCENIIYVPNEGLRKVKGTIGENKITINY